MALNIGDANPTADGSMKWFQSEDGTLQYGNPGQVLMYEYVPSTGELWNLQAAGGQQIPAEIIAQFPGAKVVNVTPENFPDAFKDDFAGKLGDYMIPAVAALVGGGMIAPWAMGGGAAAGSAGLAPGTAGYGGAFDPAVGAGAFDGLGGGAAAGGGSLADLASTGGNIPGMGLADPWGAGAVSGTGALAEAPTALSGMAGGVVDAVAPGAGGWGAGLASSAAGLAGAAGGAGSELTSLAALKNILANGGTVDDWLKTAGAVGPALLGAYASNEQANSLADLATKYEGYGAPSRARYEGSFAPGFTMESDPGYTDALNQSAKATLAGMSAKFGNPAGSPNAWAATLSDLYKGTAYPALQNYRNQNAATSGIGAFNAAAPQAQTGQLQAQGNIYNAIGSGIGNIFSPAPSLVDIMRQFQTAKG